MAASFLCRWQYFASMLADASQQSVATLRKAYRAVPLAVRGGWLPPSLTVRGCRLPPLVRAVCKMGRKKKSRKVVPLAARGCFASPVSVGYLFPAGSMKHMACNFGTPVSERSCIISRCVTCCLDFGTCLYLSFWRCCLIHFACLRCVGI